MGFAVQTDMVLPPIHLLGTEEQKQRYLVPGIKGEKIGCLGITEPGAGSDVAGIRTKAIRDGDDLLISGSKTFITNGAARRLHRLGHQDRPRRRHEGITLFLVDLRDDDGNLVPGFEVSRTLEKMGMHASDTARAVVRRGPRARRAVLGEIGKGFYHISWELQGERMVAAAGCRRRRRADDRATLEYAKEREAFGRPIGKFQAIRHKFAEMATKIEAAKQLNYVAAWRFANGEYPVREITMAKLFAFAGRLRGRRRVPADPRRLRLHEGVRDRARLPRRAPQPHRRRHRRDHARRNGVDSGARRGEAPGEVAPLATVAQLGQ